MKKNILFNVALTLSNIVLPIVTFPYASHILGPSGIGKVQFAQTFVQYFSFLAALGVPIYGVRAIAQSKNNLQRRRVIFSNLVFLNFLFSLVFLLIYFFIVTSSDFLIRDKSFYIVGVLPIFLSFSNVDWFFAGTEKFKIIALRSIIAKLITSILIFVLVKNRIDDLVYFSLLIISILISNIYNIITLRGEFSIVFVNKKEIKYHIRPLILIFATVIAGSIYSTVDVLILGRIRGYTEVGFYSAATKINKMTVPVLTAISSAILPRLSFEFDNLNFAEGKKIVQNSLDVTTLLGIPLVMGVTFLAPELVKIIAGNEFNPAIISVQIMAPIILIISLSTIFSMQILTPLSKDLQNATSIFCGLIISVTLNLVLVYKYGYIGTTISYVTSELIVMLMFVYFAIKEIKFQIKWREILIYLTLSMTFIILINQLREIFISDLIVILLSILFCLIWYFGALYFIVRNNLVRKEVNLLLKSKIKH